MAFTLSNETNLLLKYFSNTNKYSNTNKSSQLNKIYQDISEAYYFIQEHKDDIELNTNKINDKNIRQNIPNNVRQNINNLKYNLSYNFILFDRPINIFFFFNQKITNKIIHKFNNFSQLMFTWLYICSRSNPADLCQSSLNIYIYLTPNLKILPKQPNLTLGIENANTAFTAKCSNIIIFRKEEWFKVFIHETMHNFNLDFSLMNENYKIKILKIFNVNSDVNLYESYVEFWARILNCCFISFLSSKNSNTFILKTKKLISNEIYYSTFQLVKVLNYMNLNYYELCYDKNKSKQNYSEETNILSYYIIATILINNYDHFLSWCDENNSPLYNFRKSLKNINNFCNFIKIYYLEENLLDNISKCETIFFSLKEKINKNSSINFILNNLRMTIYELQ